MKVLIAGSRRKWWPDPDKVAELVDGMCDGLEPDRDVLVNGMEPSGVDHWAKEAAEQRGVPIDPYPADWIANRRAAGHLRNEEMARVADEVWLVWDGKSPGTKDMLDLAIKYRRHLTVVFPLAEAVGAR